MAYDAKLTASRAVVRSRSRTRLPVSSPSDSHELEAERVADQVMRVAEPRSGRCACGGVCPECQSKQRVDRQSLSRVPSDSFAPPMVKKVLESPGDPLDATARSFLEPRMGADLSHVRIHTDSKASESARSIDARAYAFGNHAVFGAGEYEPRTRSGLRLLAHELTHVMQQQGGVVGEGVEHGLSPVVRPCVQRTLGDGHDLGSPRFSRLLDLEAAFDDETVIRKGSSGRGVQAIQQALYDLGYTLSVYGADGEFGSKTEEAVKAFQRDNPPLVDDGEVGDETMAALSARFGARPALPPSATLAAPWTSACVLSVLCPWSPHTVDVLRTRITLKSFDSISWADEVWNGSSWVSSPFPGAGYNDHASSEIGVLNSNCEKMSETLYHEVLHSEQPSMHRTTRAKESYAYRIGEEFSIAMGLGGIPSLRTTDPQGREFADSAKVGSFVATAYPSVPAGGGGDQIVGKAATHGHVVVERPDRSRYSRPAAVGEKVPGPIQIVNEATQPTSSWTCP